MGVGGGVLLRGHTAGGARGAGGPHNRRRGEGGGSQTRTRHAPCHTRRRCIRDGGAGGPVWEGPFCIGCGIGGRGGLGRTLTPPPPVPMGSTAVAPAQGPQDRRKGPRPLALVVTPPANPNDNRRPPLPPDLRQSARPTGNCGRSSANRRQWVINRRRLPANRRRLPPNRRQWGINCRRLPANRRRLPPNRRRRAINCRRLPANRRRLPVNRRRLTKSRPRYPRGPVREGTKNNAFPEDSPRGLRGPTGDGPAPQPHTGRGTNAATRLLSDSAIRSSRLYQTRGTSAAWGPSGAPVDATSAPSGRALRGALLKRGFLFCSIRASRMNLLPADVREGGGGQGGGRGGVHRGGGGCGVGFLAGSRPVAPPSRGVQGLRHGALTKPRGLPHTRPLHVGGRPCGGGVGTPRGSILRPPVRCLSYPWTSSSCAGGINGRY